MPEESSQAPASREPVRSEQLVLELGRSLHRYGTPAHRIEAVLEHICAQLGLQAQFFAVPTAIHAAFGPLGAQRGGLVRLEPGGVDLGKLARLDEVIKAVASRQLDHDAALGEIEAIAEEPPPWPTWLLLLSFALASAAAVRFFGGGGTEMLVSGVIGLLLGVLHRVLGGGAGRHSYVPLAAALGAALAHAGQWVAGPYLADVVTVSGLLYLLPGLTLTIAITELSTRHLVSGTARLTAAGLVLLELAFGIALGGQLGGLLPPAPPLTPAVLPAWSEPLAVAVAALSYMVLFHGRVQDAIAIVVAGLVAFYGARLGALAFGPQLGAWVGALAVGMGCNAYARRLDRPPTVPLVPAILLLVPGSIGLRSMTWLLQDETVKAVDAAFEMTLVAVALTIGVLMANLVVSPRRSL